LLLGGCWGWDQEDGGKRCEGGKEHAITGHWRVAAPCETFLQRSDSIGRYGQIAYRVVGSRGVEVRFRILLSQFCWGVDTGRKP
jgi:hypothetical protein